MIDRLLDKAAMQIAWWMPARFVVWCSIRVWAHGTQGKWSNQDVTTLTVTEALKRWDEK